MTLAPKTEFQKMLAEYHDLNEQLLGILDEENPDILDLDDEDDVF